MIANITKGSSARGGMAYDHGPGRRDEHRNPHKVAGNVPGRSWRDRARVMDAHHKDNAPKMSKPVHRASINLAQEDRRLTDKEWRRVAERYVQKMGFERCPWEAIRHDDGHIHMTIVRVQWDGSKVRDSHDYRRSQSTCRAIERDHGLSNAERKFNRGRPQVRNAERTKAQRRNVIPEKDLLRDRIQEAERASNGTRASYEERLTEAGVNYRANVATTGRVSGYSYGLDGHLDADGEPVMYKGSQLGKDYRWAETERRLDAQRAQSAAEQERSEQKQRASELDREQVEEDREQVEEDREQVAEVQERDDEQLDRAEGELDREQVEDDREQVAEVHERDDEQLDRAEGELDREQVEEDREQVAEVHERDDEQLDRAEGELDREQVEEDREQIEDVHERELTPRERAIQRSQERAEQREGIRDSRERQSDRTNDNDDFDANVRPAGNNRTEQPESDREYRLPDDRASDGPDMQAREGDTPTERNERMPDLEARSDDDLARGDDSQDGSPNAQSVAQQRQQERAARQQEREAERDQDRGAER